MGRPLNGVGSHLSKTLQYFSYFIFVIGCVEFAFASSRYKHYHRAPIIDLNGAEKLIGIIREDERVVSISPQLRIMRDTDEQKGELPFKSHIIDKTDGSAQIRLRDDVTLDCSNGEYNLQVVAVRCADDSARSESVTLKITIKDTNNHAPEFEAPWYSFDVNEGKVTEIARLYASDGDCGHPYGKICRYEITNTLDGNPFRIDDQGSLSTIVPLNASQSESHILTVIAYDCGMLSSKSTLVTIHVRPKCIEGLVKKANSVLGSIVSKPDSIVNINFENNRLLSNIDVALCSKNPICTVKSAESKILLHQIPAIMNIDAKKYKNCGFKAENVELFPEQKTPMMTKPLVDLEKNDNEEDDQEDNEKLNKNNYINENKNFFDGKSNAVIVPSTTLKEIISDKFTFTFSMKHKAGTNQEQSVKQNILCESDDFAMNRHHFAVYLRHCKLELLLRREAKNSVSEFRAAEWRWQTLEVCDDKWHSYAIVFTDLNNVKLFVDGNLFDTSERNPEILDDWPLHETKQHKTRTVVGACWHGRQQIMVQHFTGHLAKVFFAPGIAEPLNAIECLHKQQANLHFGAIERLFPGEAVIFDKLQSGLILKANNLKNLSSLLHNVELIVNASALNSKRQSQFSVITHVNCVESNKSVLLDIYKAHIFMTPKAPESTQLLISGQTLINVERQSLKSGVAMLPNIEITVTQPDGTAGKDVTVKHNLDWCKVHLKPSRDMDLEYFSSPAALISFLNIDFEHDKQGIMLKGKESVKNYGYVLSKIRYYNTRAESYNKRMYTVHCSILGGKVLSNEFFVQMDIVDNSNLEETIDKLSNLSIKLETNQINQDISSAAIEEQEVFKLENHFEPSFDQLGANRLQNILEMDLPRPKALLSSHRGYDMGQGAIAGGAVAIVAIICIGFLLVLLVIGVLKMRDSPLPRRARRSRKSTLEGMEWDDNGMNMNITINPLMDTKKQDLDTGFGYGSDVEESLDDEESYREEDELTDDDDEGIDGPSNLQHPVNSKQGLEWDDSTLGTDGLSHSSVNGVSKTYCV